MLVSYHCRSCGQVGEKEISLNTLSKKREELDLHTLSAIMVLIDHECKNSKDPKIGIKLISDNKT